MDFCNLHRHSDASPLDGAGTSWQFAERAAEFGQTYLAQTDHATMGGALKHLKACQENGIIPIQGVEAYWRPDRHVRGAEWRYRRWHMVLLATNLKGWHNLIRITSASYVDGFYQNPCVDWELLEQYQEGLICTTACALGPVAYLLENGTDQTVNDFLDRALEIFGDRFFVELMPHDWDRQRSLNLELVSLADCRGIGYYATVDSHYVDADWADTQKIITLIGTNTTVAEAAAKNRERLEHGDEVYELGHEGLHLMSGDEVRERFMRFHPDLGAQVVDRAIATTMDVARMVKPYLMDRALKMPKSVEDPERDIIVWCRQGMERIGKAGDDVYERQLDYELSVIRARKNFSYMWLVGDLVRWAKSDAALPPSEDEPNPQPKKPIRIGPGRGSAAGSLVSYLCGITSIDPLRHKLKFERFLNPERHGLPDVDIDFESVKVDGYNRRPECKEYLVRKHGRGAVADVVSYSTYQPRAAIKDVARIMGIDFKRTEDVIKLIDPVQDSDLEEMCGRIPALYTWSRDFPEAWTHASRLENAGNALVSRMSKHAAGVVIVPGDVVDFMPVVRAAEGEIGYRTAWSETPQISICDDFGFVKIDILGLAGIARQQMAIDSIRELSGEVVDLDALPALRDPYDVDPEVMRVFQDGHTLGLNQFGGGNITSFLRQMRPENIVDLAAANALFRPGPIGSGAPWSYAKRKNGEEEWEVPDQLKDVLGETYGICCFQEQVMEVFQVLAGYSAGRADDVRKIIAKLYREKGDRAKRELRALYEEFEPKARERDMSSEQIADIWAQILPFSGYSFGRGHASGYSCQGYQDAYLKRYYPIHFYAALLTTSNDLALQATREARFFDVGVLPPDINISRPGFTVDYESNALRYGLCSVKGVGDAAAEQVIADRPYASLEDFEQRSSRKYSKVNKGSREKLLQVGALDCFGARITWDPIDRAKAELELLGVALEPGGLLGEDAALIWENVYTEQEIEELPEDSDVIIGGAVIETRTTTVKRGRQKGEEMAFVKLSLDLESYSITCFPDAWASMRSLVESGEMLLVRGRCDDRGSIIAQRMMKMDDYISQKREQVVAA
jgi:DNA polymerase-3 subunit alpha